MILVILEVALLAGGLCFFLVLSFTNKKNINFQKAQIEKLNKDFRDIKNETLYSFSLEDESVENLKLRKIGRRHSIDLSDIRLEQSTDGILHIERGFQNYVPFLCQLSGGDKSVAKELYIFHDINVNCIMCSFDGIKCYQTLYQNQGFVEMDVDIEGEQKR